MITKFEVPLLKEPADKVQRRSVSVTTEDRLSLCFIKIEFTKIYFVRARDSHLYSCLQSSCAQVTIHSEDSRILNSMTALPAIV